jgi:hypothetical protein
MMHSPAADFPIHFYDAASTLYHLIAIIDNRKIEKTKKVKRLLVNATAPKIVSMYAHAVSVHQNTRKDLLNRNKLKYTVKDIFHIIID